MAILTNYDEFLAVEALDVKDVFFVTGKEPPTAAKDQDIIGFIVSNAANQKKVFELDAKEVINKIVSSINDIAGAAFKGSKFIEPSEIETIKQTLANYEARNEKLAEIKKELEKFGTQIKTKYTQNIDAQINERTSCTEQIEMLMNARQEVIRKRLLRLAWPYDEKTKAYERKIAALKVRVAKHNYKIEQLAGMRPAADEKDILLFQLQLKSKFAA